MRRKKRTQQAPSSHVSRMNHVQLIITSREDLDILIICISTTRLLLLLKHLSRKNEKNSKVQEGLLSSEETQCFSHPRISSEVMISREYSNLLQEEGLSIQSLLLKAIHTWMGNLEKRSHQRVDIITSEEMSTNSISRCRRCRGISAH